MKRRIGNTESPGGARSAGKRIVMAAAVLILAVSAGFAQHDVRAEEGLRALENMQFTFRSVAQNVLPSVVEINTVNVVTRQVPQLPFFFRTPQQQQGQEHERSFRQQGLGSGVIVRRTDGTVYVLTNSHVVRNANEIAVTLHDGRKYDAKLVGADDRKDLALVSFETRESIPVASLGDSNSLYVGDWVLAIGNPFGFESTVTAGIVSAIGRRGLQNSQVGGFNDYIQTDASINQGNSGGALVNLKGEVIGINSWIASPAGGSVGLGFAIPINNAKRAIDDFITSGRVEYGWVGISIAEPTEAVVEDMKLEGRTGAFVYHIFQGSPADQAGIRPGDYIVRIDSSDITDGDDLIKVVGNMRPGTTSRFELYRLGRRMNVTVKMAARPDETSIGEQAKKLWPGFTVVKVNDSIRSQLGLPRNAGDVIVSTVEGGSPAAIAGLRSGDIVQSINGKEIGSILDFYQAVAEPRSDELLFQLFREGTRITIGLRK